MNTLGEQPSIVKGCQRLLLLASPSPYQNQEAGQPKSKKMWSLWNHLTKNLFGRNLQTWSLTPFFCQHRLLCHKQAQSQVVSQATIESSVFFSILYNSHVSWKSISKSPRCRLHVKLFFVNFKKKPVFQFLQFRQVPMQSGSLVTGPPRFCSLPSFPCLPVYTTTQVTTLNTGEQLSWCTVYTAWHASESRGVVCVATSREPTTILGPHLLSSLLPNMSTACLVVWAIAPQNTSISWSKVISWIWL